MSNNKKARLARITIKEILQKRENKCETCGRTEWLTLDHIIPIQLLKDMGFSDEEMYAEEGLLRLLCRPCNVLKKNHLDFSDKRTVKLLEWLLMRFK